MRLIVSLAAIILVADQLTKWWALQGLRFGAPVPIIDGFFSLTLVMNPGLAFGMLGGVPESLRWMVGLLSVGAVVVLALLAARLLVGGGVWTRLALGLIFCALAWLSDSLYGLAAGTIRGWFDRSPKRIEAMGGAGGVIMVGLGVRLALTGRSD